MPCASAASPVAGEAAVSDGWAGGAGFCVVESGAAGAGLGTLEALASPAALAGVAGAGVLDCSAATATVAAQRVVVRIRVRMVFIVYLLFR